MSPPDFGSTWFSTSRDRQVFRSSLSKWAPPPISTVMQFGGLFEPELAAALDPTTTLRSRSQSAAVILVIAPWFSGLAALIGAGEPFVGADRMIVLLSALSIVGGMFLHRFPNLIPFVIIPPLGAVLIGIYGYLGRGPTSLATGGMYATLAVMVAMFFPPREAFPINGFVGVCLLVSELSRSSASAACAAALPTIGWVGAGTMVVSSLRRAVNELFARLNHQSRNDDLTGVANRRSFLETGRVLLAGRPPESKVGLLIVDLDRFREINDTLGHLFGDLLLVQVAQRLGRQLRQSDSIARLGGDEFAILLPGLRNHNDASHLAAHLVRALDEPFVIDGAPITIGASIGVAIGPDDGGSTGALLQAADLAMHEAKITRAGYLRSTSATSNAPANVLLLGALRDAISNDELVLHYQPKLNVADRSITGCEALVRWQHPVRGLVPPEDFIPIAERTGLIHQLTLWAMNETLRQSAAWKANGQEICISVNISTRSLLDRHFVGAVTERLNTFDISPELLCLEVTEGTIMTDPDAACAVLSEFRDMGVRISIDDFGTGYSSLAYLRSIPATELKIDKTFISEIGGAESPPANVAIVDATLHLAHNLGLTVVAEGVENLAALDLLSRLGCDEAQGYYFARPLPSLDFAGWRSSQQLAHRLPVFGN